jgi:uncharacterized delta-60 repeat protein
MMVAALVLPATAEAAPGDLRGGYGTGGVATTGGDPPLFVALGSAVDAAGRTYAPAQNADDYYDARVVRFDASGRPDPGFGTGGYAGFGPRTRQTEVTRAVAGPGGTVYVSGGTTLDMVKQGGFVARLTDDGRLDPSWGDGGIAMVGGSEVYGLAVRGDGTVLAAETGSFYGPARVYALDPSGAPVPAYGEGGVATLTIADGHFAAFDLALAPDGSAVVAGPGVAADGSRYWTQTARLTPAGELDAAYGEAGFARVPQRRPYDATFKVALDRAGGVLLGGYSFAPETGQEVLITRLRPDGAPDAAFDRTGVAGVIPTGAVLGLAPQPSGKLLVSGYGYEGAGTRPVLMRIGATGALDRSFGRGGVVVLPRDAAFAGVSLAPGGDAIAVGVDNAERRVIAARVAANEAPLALSACPLPRSCATVVLDDPPRVDALGTILPSPTS